MDIIDCLIKYIEDNCLSQAEFAKRIGYDAATINRIINRKTPITKPFKRNFIITEGFPLEDLLGEESKQIISETQAIYRGKERRKNVLDRRTSINEMKLLSIYSIITNSGEIDLKQALGQLKDKFLKTSK